MSVPVAGASSSGEDPVAIAPGSDTKWIAAERIKQLRAIFPESALNPEIEPPASYANDSWTPEEALVEVMRGRLDALGPVTVSQLAESFLLPTRRIEQALAKLEGEGFAMQGQFTPGYAGVPAGDTEHRGTWVQRVVFAPSAHRIHSYTPTACADQPVSAADFMRFLLWQKVAGSQSRRRCGHDSGSTQRALTPQLDHGNRDTAAFRITIRPGSLCLSGSRHPASFASELSPDKTNSVSHARTPRSPC
jgi:hypothetical protein